MLISQVLDLFEMKSFHRENADLQMIPEEEGGIQWKSRDFSKYF